VVLVAAGPLTVLALGAGGGTVGAVLGRLAQYAPWGLAMGTAVGLIPAIRALAAGRASRAVILVAAFAGIVVVLSPLLLVGFGLSMSLVPSIGR